MPPALGILTTTDTSPSMPHRLDFEHTPWEMPAVGVAQKVFSDGKARMRRLRFSDDFVEEQWCTKGHAGYVLDGAKEIAFDGTTVHYKKGDGVWIAPGEASKHKAIIRKGGFVELILFEPKA
ncbi:hypothetical protein ACXYMU_11575 [Pontibacter sp. CAU 1760]